MKVINIISIFLLLILTSCVKNGGGVTVENPPNPTPSQNDSVFNQILSSFKLTNTSNIEITGADVNQNIKLVLTAKDQYGNLLKGLNVKIGLSTLTFPESVANESSPGVYTLSLSLNYQGNFTAYIKVNNITQSLINKSFTVSLCNGTQDLSAAPFFKKTTISSNLYYVICSEVQLSQAKNFTNQNYILGKSLDMNNFYVDANLDNIPDNQFKIGNDITPYSGFFSGNGFNINNFKYINQNDDFVGLFGKVDSDTNISGVNLIDAQIVGNSYTGGLVGFAEGSNISISNNSIIFNKFIGHGNYIGGLIGSLNNLGSEHSVVIYNNYTEGSLDLDLVSTLNQESIGGLIGESYSSDIRDNSSIFSFNFTNNRTVSNIGGTVGYLASSSNNLFKDNSVDSNMIYKRGENFGCLVGNINNTTIESSSFINCQIDNSDNINIINSGGLFGIVNNSIIKNTSASINATSVGDKFGAFAANSNTSDFEKITISGNITTSSNSLISSGFIAESYLSNYTKITSYVSISGSNQNIIGGIIGKSNSDGLSKISSYGILSSNSSLIIGGIIGESIGNNLSIENSLFESSISGNNLIGSIIGKNGSSTTLISKVYSNTSISGGLSSTVGGLIGHQLNTDLFISDSFSLGSLSGNSKGSFFGQNDSVSITASNNKFLSESSTTTNICGNSCSFTLSEFEDTNTFNPLLMDITYYQTESSQIFLNWDFTNDWILYSGSFPYLR